MAHSAMTSEQHFRNRHRHSWRINPEYLADRNGVASVCYWCGLHRIHIFRGPAGQRYRYRGPDGKLTAEPGDCIEKTAKHRKPLQQWLNPMLRTLAAQGHPRPPRDLGLLCGMSEKQAHTALLWLLYHRAAERVAMPRGTRMAHYQITEAGRAHLDRRTRAKQKTLDARQRYEERKRAQTSEIVEIGWRRAYALGYPPELCFAVAAKEGVAECDLPIGRRRGRSLPSKQALQAAYNRRRAAKKADDQLVEAYQRGPLHALDTGIPQYVVAAAVWLHNGRRLWQALSAMRAANPGAVYFHGLTSDGRNIYSTSERTAERSESGT